MKKLIYRIILLIAAISFFQTGEAQKLEEKYKRNIQELKAQPQGDSNLVINAAMIEKFYKTYDEVEVVSWKEVFVEEDFESVKRHLNAYNNIDLSNAESGNIQAAINRKTDEINSGYKDEVLSKTSLASFDSLDNNVEIQTQ